MAAVVVFDLDGTLVDSLPDIAAAVNKMLAEAGQSSLSNQTVRQFVGNGLPKLVERVIAHCSLEAHRHKELTQRTLYHYSNAASAQTVVYSGVTEALAELRDLGCKMGVCTNKPEAPARHILEDLNLSQFFGTVIGGDTLSTRKPDPTHLYASFDALPAVGPRIFVGDSEVDAETAEHAQIPFLLFTQGYSKTPVEQMPCTARYDHSAELPGLVRELIQSGSKPN